VPMRLVEVTKEAEADETEKGAHKAFIQVAHPLKNRSESER
jgi:hypothetical protein